MERMSVQPVKDKPLIIGLTGGIASGKTTASRIFKACHIPIIDSDHIVKELWAHDVSMRQEIEDAFGYTMDESGIKRLTQEIFSNDDKRKVLNRIIHPRVFKRIEDLKEGLYHEPIIMIDMPLLIEVGYQKEVDITVLVYVDQQTQLKRLIARDHLGENDAYMRINSQMSLEEKKAHADVILDNRSDIQHLEKQIIGFLKSIKHEE